MRKFVSSKEILLRFRDNFLPQNSNWLIDAVSWIKYALQDIGCGMVYVMTRETLTVKDGRALLPCNYKALDKVFYNGKTLTKNAKEDEDYYNWNGNQPNYIFLSFISGDIELSYYQLAWDEDSSDAVRYPYIPDSEKVKQCIEWRILYQSLLRGFKHQVITDWKEPFQLYNMSKREAQNDLMMLSSEDYQQVIEGVGMPDKLYNNRREYTMLSMSPIDNSNELFNIENANGDTSVISSEYIPVVIKI